MNVMTKTGDKRDAALAEAFARFLERRPKTAALHARAAKVMPGGNTRTVLFTPPLPIRIEHAEGALLTDIDGHNYIDFLGEYSAGIYGHSHPRIRKEVTSALEQGLNLGAHHEAEVRFAEAVCARFDLDLVRFTNSGTEANMMALGAARAFTGRRKVLGIKGGYHGGTLYFSAGGMPVNAPYEIILAPLNDISATRKLIEDHASDLAAVLIEPMMGSGGCFPASPEFLAMLRSETKKHGIVLIFDEVMTSRLHPKGLSAEIGIAPDLKTLGKYIGGGMSFGAFGGVREIMGRFDPARPDALPHAGTFNNNTLTMNVGHVAITEVFTPEACVTLNAMGDALKARLNNLFMEHQAQMRVTGRGSMLTIHPVGGEPSSPDDIASADVRLRHLLYLDLLEEGLYIAGRGFMALSLALDDVHCDRLTEAVSRFLDRRRDLVCIA